MCLAAHTSWASAPCSGPEGIMTMLSRCIALAGLALALSAANAQAAPLHKGSAPARTHAAKATPATAKTDPSVQAILKSAPSASAYPNSAAATLLDESVVDFSDDGTYTERTHEIIKVFNERGRDEADVAIP